MENTYVAQKQVLQLTVQFQGVLQKTAPKPQPNPGPHLIIYLNGTVQSVVHLPKPQSSESIEAELRDDHDKPFKGIDNLQKQVQHYLDKTGGTKCNQEDGPDWMFDKGEVTVRVPDYVFALHHTESRFFTSSQGISANIPSLLNMMAVRLGRKISKRQSSRCMISVLGEACMRSGDISGQGGTHQKCGASGHDQLCH